MISYLDWATLTIDIRQSVLCSLCTHLREVSLLCLLLYRGPQTCLTCPAYGVAPPGPFSYQPSPPSHPNVAVWWSPAKWFSEQWCGGVTSSYTGPDQVSLLLLFITCDTMITMFPLQLRIFICASPSIYIQWRSCFTNNADYFSEIVNQVHLINDT